MDTFYIFIIFCVIFYTLYNLLTNNYDYWKKRNVVYLPPRLFVGNYSDYVSQKKNVGEIHRDLYERFRNEKFIGLYNFRKPELIIKDPDDIRRVLISDFGYFQDRLIFKNEKIEPLNDNLFTAISHRWKPMRQMMTPAFTSGKLRNMVPLILEIGNEFNNYIKNVVLKESETECHDLMGHFNTDVIGSVAFGIQMNSMLDTDMPFRKMGRKILQVDKKRFFKMFIRSLFAEFYKLLKLRTSSKEVEDFFTKVLKDVIDQRERSENFRNDFINLMLDLKKKHQSIENKDTSKIIVDEKFILSQAFIFFLAGFETSSTLMSFALYELALHQDIQEKLYKEIQKNLEKYDGKLVYESFSEMHYMDMVLCETQRKYPALCSLTRVCTSRYTFPDTKIIIDKGITVLIPILALHYDPKFYPDPEKFIPERFTAEEKQKRDPMTFLPFGEGPRNCIGLRLGKIQTMIGLISLLKDYSVKPCSKTKDKIKLNPVSFVTASDSGVWLTIKRRIESKKID